MVNHGKLANSDDMKETHGKCIWKKTVLTCKHTE